MPEREYGLLGRDYLEGRTRRSELRFRLAGRAAAVADVVRRHTVPLPELRVVDLGCAEGRTMLELARRLPVRSATGVELSRELVDAAADLPAGLEVVHGDITDLGELVEDGSADLVTALAVLEHLPAPQAAVAEACRCLRPGGLFVASCPNPFWERISARLGLLADGAQHLSDLDRKRLIGTVRAAGLEPVEFSPFMWAPVAVLSYAHIPVSARLAVKLDRIIHRIRILDLLFVNQLVAARKPG